MATDPAPEVPSINSKHFLLSKTFWIALLGFVVAPLLKKIGIEFDDAAKQDTADTILKLITAASVVWARARAQGPLHFGGGPAASIIAIAALILTGCAGFTSKLAKLQSSPVTQALERDALNIGLGFLAASVSGQDVDAAWGIRQGLHTIVDAVKAMPNPEAQTLVRDTALAFAGTKNANISIFASQLAIEFGGAAPKTPEERAAAVIALANGISKALTQPAALGAAQATTATK